MRVRSCGEPCRRCHAGIPMPSASGELTSPFAPFLLHPAIRPRLGQPRQSGFHDQDASRRPLRALSRRRRVRRDRGPQAAPGSFEGGSNGASQSRAVESVTLRGRLVGLRSGAAPIFSRAEMRAGGYACDPNGCKIGERLTALAGNPVGNPGEGRYVALERVEGKHRRPRQRPCRHALCAPAHGPARLRARSGPGAAQAH